MAAMFTVLFVVVLISCNLEMSWGGGKGGGKHSHDMGSKKELKELYNSKVVHVQEVSRPISSSGGSSLLPHKGVVVTTDHGDKYLVHKGPNFGGSGGQTVVVKAEHMSEKWTAGAGHAVTNPTTVSKVVKDGGPNYSMLTDNCLHATQRMKKNK